MFLIRCYGYYLNEWVVLKIYFALVLSIKVGFGVFNVTRNTCISIANYCIFNLPEHTRPGSGLNSFSMYSIHGDLALVNERRIKGHAYQCSVAECI